MSRTLFDLWFDLKYAARVLAGHPSYALAVSLTLALGLGLNAAVFGMMDALLLRPFQFVDYQRLVVLFETARGSLTHEPAAPATYLAWRQQMRSVERLAAWEGWGATLGHRSEPERLQGFRVSAGFFEILGIEPQVGRVFAVTDEQPGNDKRVIVGDALWKRRFGADPGIVGTELLLDDVAHTIVGIAPPGFDFPVGAEIWAPLAISSERAVDRTNRSLTVVGKLAASTSLDEARAELEVIAQQLATQYPETNAERGVAVRTLSTAFREDMAGSLVAILQLGAGLVLLVACGNLAGLLLARANDRQREVAVRSALGASRMRIVRQLVAETVLLAIVASVLGLFVAHMGLEVLRTAIPADRARYVEGWNNVRLDSRLMVITPALAMLIGLGVGLIPALSATRGRLSEALKDGDRGTTGGVRRQRVRQGLVVAEIAFALTLLVAAGLTLAGGIRIIEAPGGFDARALLTFDIPLPGNRYQDTDVRREFARELVARLAAVPGVERAALANVLPAAGWSPSRPLFVEDAPVHDATRRPAVGYRAVSAEYFETMRIPILRGRSFSAADREDTERVAIVSTSLAARFWSGSDPIGRRVQVGDSPGDWLIIVGVARDVTMYNWWDGIDFSAIYVPLQQAPPANVLSAAVRTRTAASAAAAPLRAALTSVDPLLAVDNMRTMDQAIAGSTFGLNFLASLLGICGGIGLVLAAVGIYSTMSYAVSQRRHEFGLRMALGASAGDVLRLSLRQAGLLTAGGLVIGLLLAASVGRLMSSALFGVIQLDAPTFLAVSASLTLVSLAAAFVPALRSVRVDPATVLRSE